jgi:hypothetical protein
MKAIEEHYERRDPSQVEDLDREFMDQLLQAAAVERKYGDPGVLETWLLKRTLN